MMSAVDAATDVADLHASTTVTEPALAEAHALCSSLMSSKYSNVTCSSSWRPPRRNAGHELRGGALQHDVGDVVGGQ